MSGPATTNAAAPQRPPIRNDDYVTVDDIDNNYDFTSDSDGSDDDAFSTSSSEDLPIEVEELKRDTASKKISPSADSASAAPASVLTFRNICYSVSVKQRKGDPAGAGPQFARQDSTLANLPGLPPQQGFPASISVTAQTDEGAAGTSAAARDGGGIADGMRQKRVRRQILTGVNAEARSGERKGTVELDGAEVRAGTMRRVSAYVMQDDVLFPSLTVRETLMYAAELRLDSKTSRREKEQKVARLIDLLGLAKVENSPIGGERKRPEGLVIRLSFLSCASGIVFYSSCDAVPIFIEECAIFVRESANNAYRPSTYLMSSTLVYLPLHFLMALLLTAVSWWSISLAGGAEGFLFMVVAFFVMFFAANAIVTCVSTCVKDVVLAYALAISVMSYFYLVCGFYVTRRQMPAVLIWLHYLSPFKYAYEALAINQFARPSPCYLSVADSMPKLPNNMLSTLSIPSSLNNSLAVPPSSSNSNSSLSPTPEQLQSQLLSVLFINPIPDSALSGLSPEMRAQVEAASGGCLLSGPQLLVSRSVDQLGKLECLAVLLAIGLAVKLITLLLLVRLRRAKHK
ncbi:unnamed protein product [Closterium sp. Naga37s-1]|nr:unnamed protein product [Closterium sp. Naga37s-1]